MGRFVCVFAFTLSVSSWAGCGDSARRIGEVRRLSTYDLDQVIHIENATFQFPWSLKEFKDALLEDNTLGLIAELEGRVLAYAIYSLYTDKIVIKNLAVHPHYRRRTIGRQLVERLRQKLKILDIPALSVDVRETNLPAQLFFKAAGFQYVETIEKLYMDSPLEDAYRLEYLDRKPTNFFHVMDGRVEQPGKIRSLTDSELDELLRRLTQ